MASFNAVYDAALARSVGRGNMLGPTAVPVTGGWLRVAKLRPVAISLVGTFAGTAVIRVSNEESPAFPASHYPAYGEPLVAQDVRIIDMPFENILVDVTAVTSGSIDTVDVAAG